MPNPEFKNPEISDSTKEVKSTTTNENPEDAENRVLANINNAEEPWKTAFDIMNNWNSREAYYVIRNLNQFENKINSETEKNIIIMAVKKCRQPWSVLSHWKNFTLLSKEDKKEIAQTFVECGDTDILIDYVNKSSSSIDDESRKIFKGVISVYRNPSHHSLSFKCDREYALKFCAYIDELLKELDKSEVVS